MKEIKAYVRRDRVHQTVNELEFAGAPGITVVEVHPVGYDYEAKPDHFGPRYEDELSRYEYLAIVRLEAVCADEDVEKLVRVLRRASRTGSAGDGMIFVSNVIDAIRIRDGERGERILRGPSVKQKVFLSNDKRYPAAQPAPGDQQQATLPDHFR